MIDFGLSGKRAVVSGAGYLPERTGQDQPDGEYRLLRALGG
jgi:hypothetical protein